MTAQGIVLLLLLNAPAAGATHRLEPADFKAWFEASRAGKLTVPPRVEQAAQRFQYVFVGGFSSERLSSYFLQNARDLHARGVPVASIHFVFPSSDGTTAENASLVSNALQRAADGSNGQRLVVVAHSRGACDMLAFALRNPAFVADHVASMFLVQGPFGGSGLADGVTGDGPAPDGQMKRNHRVVVDLLGRLERSHIASGNDAGIADMTHEAARAFWTTMLKEHHDALAVVGPRTYYVTAATAPGRHRPLQKAMAWYLDTYYGANDGVVALDDQSLAGVGTVLAVLDAGHNDLTNKFPTGAPQRRLRRALIDAVVMAVANGVDD